MVDSGMTRESLRNRLTWFPKEGSEEARDRRDQRLSENVIIPGASAGVSELRLKLEASSLVPTEFCRVEARGAIRGIQDLSTWNRGPQSQRLTHDNREGHRSLMKAGFVGTEGLAQ